MLNFFFSCDLRSMFFLIGLVAVLHRCVLCVHVQVYHTLFWPLEFTVPGRDNNKCYAKIICNKLDSVRLFLRFTLSTHPF